MKVRPLCRSEFDAFLRARPPESLPLTPEWAPEKPGCIFVCEVEEALCGWLMALPVCSKPGRGCLCNIWVDPGYRNRGAASALIQAGMDWAVAHGVDALELWVRERNTRARHLYHTLGFRESGWLRASDNPEEAPCVHMIQGVPAAMTAVA